MTSINDAITDYLTTHGCMSGSDICDSLALSEIDVTYAADEPDATFCRCQPLPGGSGPWYCAR